MSANERAFFESMARRLSPGWDIRLGAHLSPGSVDFKRFNTYLYVVDTSRVAIISGAMEAIGFAHAKKCARHAEMTKDDVLGFAGYEAQALFDGGASQEEVSDTLGMVAAALTYTKAFEVAAAGPGIDGHWLYVLYRTVDRSVVSRPVFFRHGGEGFAPPALIERMTQQVVAGDLGGRPTGVADQVNSAGGAVLDESVRPRGYPAHTQAAGGQQASSRGSLGRGEEEREGRA